MQQGASLSGRYQLERRAGAGGMGEVWRARDQDTGQPVAVKLLTACSPEDAARFTREARILAGLEHPGVVRYLSHGQSSGGEPFLVMEWLDGEDLSARLTRGRLALDAAVALALSVAETLSFAHARGVVHRDLKPSNLFLVGGRLDEVKVLDFGIACAGLSTRITRTGLLMGTPGYMAPEQARGELHLDARADVFSLGCVLFECLTGEPTFRGEHPAAILTKVLFEDAPRARYLRPEVPEALDALLARMLAKRREDRPIDGRAAAASLRALGDVAARISIELPAWSAASPSLTGLEQQTVAVILVGASAHPAPPATFDGNATIELDSDAALLCEAARYGGMGERLLDGSLAIVLTNMGLATDLCAQAARCALALRASSGERPIALTMGRGHRAGRPMGMAIDRAARLCAGAGPGGTVCLDEIVAGLLDARFDVREDGGAFTLHGERTLGEGTRLLLGRATPCVGRERELATLEELFAETAEEGHAQIALVTAPAGVGKSRLTQELLAALRRRGDPPWTWIARGDALRAGSPLRMLGQALRCAAGVREGDPLAARREQLLAHLGALGGAAGERRVCVFLGEIMGVPFPDGDDLPLRAARRDAQLMADQMRAAFLDYLAAASGERPVLIVLEDLQWGDRPTVQMIDAALRVHADRPLFVLALARPEVREVFPKLWEARRLHELRLNELSRRAGERLARHVLGPRADEEAVARIVRMSQGNAFYLEELIRWTAEGNGADIPETVVAMVESRLKALDDDDRRLLRAASIFGEVFWSGGVAALVGGEAQRGAVAAGLEALVNREILLRRRDSRFPDEAELAFRHALLREGAHAMLTDEDRALGHRLAGEWLEARGEQDARVLAEHFEAGGDPQSAGRHYIRAAQQASQGGDTEGSIALTRKGLALPLPIELRAPLLGVLCEGTIYRPDMAAALRQEAEEVSTATPPGSAPWIQGMLAKLLDALVAGRREDIVATAEELVSAEVTPDAVDPSVVALGWGSYILDGAAMTLQATRLLAQFERVVRVHGDHSPYAWMSLHAIMATRPGGADGPFGAMRHAMTCHRLARETGHRRYQAISELLLALNAFCLGAYDEVKRLLEGLPMADEEFGFGSSYRRFILTWLLADRGALDEARARAAQLVAAGRDRALSLDEGRGHWALAEVLRRSGELDAAEAEARTAIQLLRTICPVDVPDALATLAGIELARGRAAEALAAAEEGMAGYTDTGICTRFFRGAFLRLAHVESLDAAGRHDDARAALAAAREKLRAVAEGIPDDAYRRSFLEDVPENHRTLALARERLGDCG